MGFSRQLFLGRQRDRCRRLGLALSVDLVTCHLQLRVQRSSCRCLQAWQPSRRRSTDAGRSLGTAVNRRHLRARKTDLGPGACVCGNAQRRLRRRCDLCSQRCLHLRGTQRCVAQAYAGAHVGRKARHGHLLWRAAGGQLHLYGGRQHIAHHRQRRRAQLQANARIRADCRAALRLSRGSRQCNFGINLDRHRLRVLGCKRLQIAQRLIRFGCPRMSADQRTQQGEGQGGRHQQDTARVTGSAATAVARGQFRGHNQSIELAVPYTPVDAVHEHFPRRRTTGMSVDLPLGR